MQILEEKNDTVSDFWYALWTNLVSDKNKVRFGLGILSLESIIKISNTVLVCCSISYSGKNIIKEL